MDKDNDGILDTNECYNPNRVYVPSTDTQGAVSGSSPALDVTLSSTVGATSFSTPQGNLFKFAETRVPVNTTYTLTFSNAINDLNLYIGSLNYLNETQKTIVGNFIVTRADNTVHNNVDFRVIVKENSPKKFCLAHIMQLHLQFLEADIKQELL